MLRVMQDFGHQQYGCSAAAVYRVYSIELHIARCRTPEAYDLDPGPARQTGRIYT